MVSGCLCPQGKDKVYILKPLDENILFTSTATHGSKAQTVYRPMPTHLSLYLGSTGITGGVGKVGVTPLGRSFKELNIVRQARKL